jgi:hypothetical protein
MFDAETSGSPRFLGNPCGHAAFSDPGEPRQPRFVGCSRCGLPCTPTPSASRGDFGIVLPQPVAPAVYASQPGLPQLHARLASGPLATRLPVGTFTRGLLSLLSGCHFIHDLHPAEPSLSWRTGVPSFCPSRKRRVAVRLRRTERGRPRCAVCPSQAARLSTTQADEQIGVCSRAEIRDTRAPGQAWLCGMEVMNEVTT